MRIKVRGGYEKLDAFSTARLMARDNGWLWTFVFAVEYFLEGAVGRITRWRIGYEEARGLPGSNSVALNFEKWDNWDWSQNGDEWTESAEWKQAVVDHILKPAVGSAPSILEIGPGAGRWTEFLKDVATDLTVVDLSPQCIEICRERFGEGGNIEYFVTPGTDLSFIDSETIDGIWSFDVFMHISPPDVSSYLRELARVMKPGGQGVIHHARIHGWHNRVGAADFAQMLTDAGFVVERQFDTFGPADEFNFNFNGAAVTLFAKP